MAAKNYALDLAERVVATYAQAYLGLWLASGLGIDYLTDLSMLDKALVATLPAAFALIKGALAKFVAEPDSASLVALEPVADRNWSPPE